MRLLCTLGLFLALLHLSTSLLLAAFNIQSFGRTKASKPAVMNHISTIVRRYDIILIQEVRDSDLSATEKLMEHVNKGSPQFRYIVSEPLGRSSYKERYLFLYRQSNDYDCVFSQPPGTDNYNERYLFIYRHQMVTVTAIYQYPPRGVFSRPPFVVRFFSPQTTVTDFVLIPQHTSPLSAVQQIDALFDVVTYVNNTWNTNNIVLLGDFNAGGTYVKKADWKNIRLFTKPGFKWLINDDAHTTVGHNKFPYDRIVATDDMTPTVVQDSAVVYDYKVALGLTQQQAKAVSDHFPVEVQLN